MTISEKKVEQAIELKSLYSKKQTDLSAGDNSIGTVLPDDAEKVTEWIAQLECSNEFHQLKEFLEGLSEEELRELQAIAFYGRGDYTQYRLAVEEAAQMEENAADIHYTMQLLAAGDYLEAGLKKLKRRQET
jgi:hypothetical protein